MSETLTIQFKAQGGAALKSTIDALYLSNLRLVEGQKKYAIAQKQIQAESAKTDKGLLALNHSTRNLDTSFSTLRSKLLLVSFGMALAVKPMLDLVKASGDLEEIMNKANVVFGQNSKIVNQWAEALGASIGRAKSSLVDMASGLQDTFVPLGFTREAATQLSTSLTELALDVGSFSNKLDADVIRDFQSAIVGNHETVRKYGIILTEGGLEQEAFNLGITETVRQLNAQEKVQARVSLITKGSADAIGDARETADSYTNTIKRLNGNWLELRQELGEALKPFVKFVAIIAANKSNVRAFGLLISSLGVYFAVVKAEAYLAGLAVGTFNKFVQRSLIGIFAIGVAKVAESFMFTQEKVQEAADSLNDINQTIEDSVESIMELTAAQERNTLSVEDSKDALIREYIALGVNSTAAEYSREIKRSLTEEELKLIDLIDEKNAALEQEARAYNLIARGVALTEEGKKKKIESDIAEIKLLQERNKQNIINTIGMEDANFILEKAVEAGEGFTIGLLSNTENVQKWIDAILEGNTAIEAYQQLLDELNQKDEFGFLAEQSLVALEGLSDFFGQYAQMSQATAESRIADIDRVAKAEVEILKGTSKYRKMTDKQKAKAEKEILEKSEKDKEKVRKKTNRLLAAQFRIEQLLSINKTLINTEEAAMKAMGQTGIFGFPMAGIIKAMGYASIALIASQKPPKMARGGMVGGRRHSEGGTMIEAEQGEFVMSRDAVNTLGVETMNRINQGGGAGNVNVTFSGNVLSEDFIENEAIPQIRDAIRRGADIGVS